MHIIALQKQKSNLHVAEFARFPLPCGFDVGDRRAHTIQLMFLLGHVRERRSELPRQLLPSSLPLGSLQLHLFVDYRRRKPAEGIEMLLVC